MPLVNHFGSGSQTYGTPAITWTSTNATRYGGSVFDYDLGYTFAGNRGWDAAMGPMAGRAGNRFKDTATQAAVHGRSDQALRAGMARRAHDLACGGGSDEAAGIHHGNAAGDFRGGANIVRDENDRHAELPLQLTQRRKDLDLNGNVKRRGRFAGQQQRGGTCQRQRSSRAGTCRRTSRAGSSSSGARRVRGSPSHKLPVRRACLTLPQRSQAERVGQCSIIKIGEGVPCAWRSWARVA